MRLRNCVSGILPSNIDRQRPSRGEAVEPAEVIEIFRGFELTDEPARLREKEAYNNIAGPLGPPVQEIAGIKRPITPR
jgi:hypothetical protein